MPTMALRVPPVIVFAAAPVVGWIVTHLFPVLRLSVPGQPLLGLGFLGIGGAIMAAAVWGFMQRRTTVNPLNPERASVLVTTGIYRVSRNPMYLAMAFIALGLGLMLAAPISAVFVFAAVAYITRFQIQPEEAALQSQFGKAFEKYRSDVRRWI